MSEPRIHESMTFPEIVAQWEALEAELRQAQEERDAALAKLTPSAVRVFAEVEQLRVQRRQAIDALREIATIDYRGNRSTESGIARAALVQLGEQP